MRIRVSLLVTAFILVLGVGTAVADVTSGLMAHYTFEGNANDVSGNGNDGLPCRLGYEEGRNGGQAGAFYGTSFVDLGTGLAPAQWTVAAWVKLYSIGNRQVIFAANDEASGEDGILLVIPKSTNGKPRARAMASGTWFHAQDGLALAPGEWTFLAGTSDGETVTLYRDGVAISQTAITEDTEGDTPTMPTVIGSRGAMNRDYFNGAIDELLVYGRALSPEEIAQLYGEGVVPEDPGVEEPMSGSADIPYFDICGSCTVKHYTIFSIANISDSDLDVMVAFYTPDGDLLKDDGTANAGLVTLNNPPAGAYWDYTDDPTSEDSVVFTLAAGKAVKVKLAHGSSYSIQGFGNIKWQSVDNATEGLVVHGFVTMSTNPYLGVHTIPVNCGLAF